MGEEGSCSQYYKCWDEQNPPFGDDGQYNEGNKSWFDTMIESGTETWPKSQLDAPTLAVNTLHALAAASKELTIERAARVAAEKQNFASQPVYDRECEVVFSLRVQLERMKLERERMRLERWKIEREKWRLGRERDRILMGLDIPHSLSRSEDSDSD